MTIEEFIGRFPSAKRDGKGFKACCPAHEDKNPSLSISEGNDGRILINCHAGCPTESVCSAVGVSLEELFPKGQQGRPPIKPRVPSPPLVEYNWQARVDAVTGEMMQQLAEWRGYSMELVQVLKARGLIGSFNGDWAIPVHDERGTVTGLHVRQKEAKWFYEPRQATRLLVIGDLARAEQVWILESQWDAFAAMDWLNSCDRLDRIALVVTRGAGNGKLVEGVVPEGKPVFAFPQNDPLKPDGSSPAQKWLKAVCDGVDGIVREVVTPSEHKDLNDWLKAGDHTSFWDAVKEAKAIGIVGQSLMDLVRPRGDDPDELLRFRYLCRGGGLLLVGPTGIGKSSMAMQMKILWALGRPAFGITPARPLKSLLVQAENDDGDLAEMRDGVMAGMDLSEDEERQVRENVLVFTEDTRSGASFFSEVLRPLLRIHQPDVLWIDPALAYLGGDTCSQKDVGQFLRNWLNPLIHEFRCGVVILHHISKPSTDSTRTELSGTDQAYAGSGSAEWGNWARAVLAVRSVKNVPGVFELCAGKRGSRIGWREADGVTKAYSKRIAHATEPGVICWHLVTEEEQKATVAKANQGKTAEDLLKLVPMSKSIPKNTVLVKAREAGIGKDKARSLLDELIESGTLFVHKVKRAGTNPEQFIARYPEPEPKTFPETFRPQNAQESQTRETDTHPTTPKG